MANKIKKTKASVYILKNIIILIVLVFFSFLTYQKVAFLLRHSDYFMIRSIICEPSLRFMEASLVSNFKGKNIFAVDLKKIERHLRVEYPRFTQLKILKRFPDQILVAARERAPFAQTKVNGKIVTLDPQGAMMEVSTDLDDRLPFIIGVRLVVPKFVLGSRVDSIALRAAFEVIKAFRSEPELAGYHIAKIDVTNLSQIYFYINDDLRIIADQENIVRQLKILGLLLLQAKTELKDVKYIDLRFKEPILGKK
ncbi:MAG TPA: hypothetical protein PL155_00125 [Candidatus Omnitrophota bacterium]|nr:hypothetical protein [Candidatus Omnitrophota bacterium]HPD85108.1 hypothetical protein [Candidatus Omnitrophota bacterium]HRZ03966.1 hypothetical protein [Candidatus Omnitrophota bacterium]